MIDNGERQHMSQTEGVMHKSSKLLRNFTDSVRMEQNVPVNEDSICMDQNKNNSVLDCAATVQGELINNNQ